jgi:hypothetical protein
MSDLNPIDPPALAPLANSFDYDQLEGDLKTIFMDVFESMMRERERNLNLYGMAHLGGDELLASALKSDGVAMVRSNSARMQFLVKATRSRNERRGLLFIKKYLQAVWPNIWQVESLWQPLATANAYPVGVVPNGNPDTHFLTGRIRITLPVTVDNGLGLTEIAKAFRSTLPARLILEFRLGTVLDNSGALFGLAVANGAIGMMPFTATGTLKL